MIGSRIFLALLLCVTLVPDALAHDAAPLPLASESGVLVAPFVPHARTTESAPPTGEASGAFAVRVPGGVAYATRDGDALVVDVLTREGGWFIVALDDRTARDTALHGVPALLRLSEAVGGAIDPVAGPRHRVGTVGVFALPADAAAGSAHAHARDENDPSRAWIQWDLADSTSAHASVVERHGDLARLRFVVRESSIGEGLRGGEVYSLFVYHGLAADLPEGPFLSEVPHEAVALRLYPARADEDAAALARVATALEGAPDAWGGLLPVGVATFGTVAALAALRAEGRVATRRPVVPPAWKVERAWSRPERRRAVAAVAVLGVLLSAGWAGAQTSAPAATEPPVIPSPFLPFDVRNPCSSFDPVRHYDVSAIDLDIIYNRWGDHDPQGMMFVLDERIGDVQRERRALEPVITEGRQDLFPTGAEPSLITPLVLRARLGECVEITFTNRLQERPPAPPVDPLDAEPIPHERPHPTLGPSVPASALPLGGPEERRASLHVHGLPIDPFVGSGDAVGRNPDSTVGINESITFRVRAAYEGAFFFHDHGDPTSGGSHTFPALDESFRGGTAHGLFGALVVEPLSAAWTDPRTGNDLGSGWAADVHSPREGSFREFVVFYQDPPLVERDGAPLAPPSVDHGLNYRVESLSHRLRDDLDRCPPEAAAANRGVNPCEDISLVYSSIIHGDPGTPMPRAYMGDPVKVRIVHAGMEETHAHHLHGHRWRAVEDEARSTRIDSQSVSPSESFTQTLEAGAGGQGVAHAPGDYLYHCHLFPHLYGGMWSMFRVHDRARDDLRSLPRHEPPQPTADKPGYPEFMQNVAEPGFRPPRPPQVAGPDPATGLPVPAVGAPYADVCPRVASERRYRLAAIEVPIQYNAHGDHDPAARIYVLAEDADAVLAGTVEPDPVVLRAKQGECVIIHLENRFPPPDPGAPIKGVGKVSIHTHLLEYDVFGTDGTATGYLFDQTTWPGESITYRFYADEELQTVVWHDHSAGLETAFKGIYGATIVEPRGALWLDPRTGEPVYSTGTDAGDGAYDSAYQPATGAYSRMWRADIVGPGFEDFREFFASIQDFANLNNANGRSYRPQEDPVSFDDFGLMAFNYRSEPLWHRTNASSADLFSSRVHGDPATNLWEAYVGDRVVLRLHQVAYEEMHAFTLHGHRWNFGYRDPTSPLVDSFTLGVSEAFNAYLECGAGGCAGRPGDYLYRGGAIDDHWAGAWGIFRVHDAPRPDLRPLPDVASRPSSRHADADPVCPPDAPERFFDVVAMEKEIIYNGYGNHDVNGRVFVLAGDEAAVREGTLAPRPLILRVEEDDCVRVRLTNRLPEWSPPHAHTDPQPTAGFLMTADARANDTRELLRRPIPAPSNHVSLHAHLLTHDVADSDGANVGLNPDSTVPPGASREFTWFADVPAPTAVLLDDYGDVLMNRHHGLFGTVLVLPRDSFVRDPGDGLPDLRGAFTSVFPKAGDPWRDLVLFYQDGLPMTFDDGRPIPLGELHGLAATPLDAAEAAKRFLGGLVPGGASRAKIQDVEGAPRGFFVRGTLEGVPFRVHVDRVEGDAVEAELGARATAADVRVTVTDERAAGIAGLAVSLTVDGVNVTLPATSASGETSFDVDLPRGGLATVAFPSESAAFTSRVDSERALRLDVRASRGDLAEAAAAAAAALDHLRGIGMPAGPVGVTRVDVTGTAWRVSADDALRRYELTMDPATLDVLRLSMTARARPLGPAIVLPDATADRIALEHVREHFGESATVVHHARTRFGEHRVELSAPGSATSLTIDGATGRVLAMERAPAALDGIAPLAGDGRVLARFVADDARPLEGARVVVERRGVLVGEGVLAHGGRFLVPEAWRAGEASATGLRLSVPDVGASVPLALAPAGENHAVMHGFGASTREDAAEAVDAARDFLERLTRTPSRTGLGGASLLPAGLLPFTVDAQWGVTGLAHGPGAAWTVSLASATHRADFLVDDYSGRVIRVGVTSWATPREECLSEEPEHGGGHPTPHCRWSFSQNDEEDQGLRAFNYRSEPFENRLNRVPEPALVFSSAIHGEAGVPIVHVHPDDSLRIHLLGSHDKARATAFSLSGHGWVQPEGSWFGPVRPAQGGVSPQRVFLLEPIGGAGGGTGFTGDYVFRGAEQRQSVEGGEWGILRVEAPDDSPSLRLDLPPLPPVRRILDPDPLPPPPRGDEPRPPECGGGDFVRFTVRLHRAWDGTLTARSTPAHAELRLPISEAVGVLLEVEGTRDGPAEVLDVTVGTTSGAAREVRGDAASTRAGGFFCLVFDTTRATPESAEPMEVHLVVESTGGAGRRVVSIPVRLLASQDAPQGGTLVDAPAPIGGGPSGTSGATPGSGPARGEPPAGGEAPGGGGPGGGSPRDDGGMDVVDSPPPRREAEPTPTDDPTPGAPTQEDENAGLLKRIPATPSAWAVAAACAAAVALARAPSALRRSDASSMKNRRNQP